MPVSWLRAVLRLALLFMIVVLLALSLAQVWTKGGAESYFGVASAALLLVADRSRSLKFSLVPLALTSWWAATEQGVEAVTALGFSVFELLENLKKNVPQGSQNRVRPTRDTVLNSLYWALLGMVPGSLAGLNVALVSGAIIATPGSALNELNTTMEAGRIPRFELLVGATQDELMRSIIAAGLGGGIVSFLLLGLTRALLLRKGGLVFGHRDWGASDEDVATAVHATVRAAILGAAGCVLAAVGWLVFALNTGRIEELSISQMISAGVLATLLGAIGGVWLLGAGMGAALAILSAVVVVDSSGGDSCTGTLIALPFGTTMVVVLVVVAGAAFGGLFGGGAGTAVAWIGGESNLVPGGLIPGLWGGILGGAAVSVYVGAASMTRLV